jgi:putative transposase
LIEHAASLRAGYHRAPSVIKAIGMSLNLPRLGKRRLPGRIQDPLEIPLYANHTWPSEFMADAPLVRLAFFAPSMSTTISNLESLRIEIDTSLPSQRVIQALAELIELRGVPPRGYVCTMAQSSSVRALRQWAK